MRRRSISLHFLLGLLLIVYGVLWVLLHRLEASPLESSVLSASLSNHVVPSLQSHWNRTIDTDAEPDQRLDFPTPNWENRLVDGEYSEYPSGSNLWDHTDLPTWMKDYFAWHQEQRAKLISNPDRWREIRYYIVECSAKFQKCGGAADRLAPLPFHIWMAAQDQRLLFFAWLDHRPAPLEDFLLPPRGGLDWRMPDWLLSKSLEANTGIHRMATTQDKIWQFGTKPKVQWLHVKFQSHDHGQTFYNQKARKTTHNDPPPTRMDPSFAQVYHDVWRICFTPSPPIADRIQTQMQTLGLFPGRFVAVHLRALYGVSEREPSTVQWWSQNAVHCATSKLPIFAPGEEKRAMPILFVSDSSLAVEDAMDYAKKKGIHLVHRPHNGSQPLHLEKDQAEKSEDYFDTFVDIWMIGMSRCAAYNMGGYGRWGAMISHNSSCALEMYAQMIKCDLVKAGRRNDFLNGPMEKETTPKLPSPLFLPSIQSNFSETQKEVGLHYPVVQPEIQLPFAFNYSHLSYELDDRIYMDPLVYEEYNSEKLGVNLWARSGKLPLWMKNYFKWHKKQRQHYLNPENWKSMRLLIMECHRHQPKCGGTSDRLKPIPTLLRIAATSKRLLLIHWTRPSRLEEFLLPPKNGLDWRVPAWLHPHLVDYGEAVTLVDDVRDAAMSKELGVRAKYQSYDGGQGWYNENLSANETEFNKVFHDVWRIFFTPSPPVATAIKNEMVQKGLAPGKYSSAHLRALYGQEYRSAGQTKIWTRNAVNCASKLRPNAPIFFASDSKIASDYSLVYGEQMNGTVVTHPNHPDPPLHLDKAENFSDPSIRLRRPVSDYYDTFIDLYLLALGRCVFLSKGGYGQWGLLIGGNTTCGMRFKRGKKKIQNPCNWTTLSDGTPTIARATLMEPLFLEPRL